MGKKIEEYFEMLTPLSDRSEIVYKANGKYEEIRIGEDDSYYIYNKDREMYTGPFGRNLLLCCKDGAKESDLLGSMAKIYPDMDKGTIARYTYMTLMKFKKRNFIV